MRAYYLVMALNREAEQLIAAVTELGLPPVEDLDAPTARSLYDNRSASVVPPDIASVVDEIIPSSAGGIRIRIFRPVDDDRPIPAIVFFHGGGWVFGTIDTHDAACRALANAAEATVISVDYRLAPEHPYPAAVDDAVAATEWIVENATELNIDADKTAVCGDSAGGNLAAIVAQHFRTDGLALVAQLLVYPLTDLSDEDSPSLVEFDDGYLLTAAAIRWFLDNYVTHPQRTDPRCSPAFGDLTGVAPTLVLTAECDPLRSQCEAYAAALVAAGVDTELVQFDGQVHSFFTQIGVLTDSQRAVDSLASFFRSRL